MRKMLRKLDLQQPLYDEEYALILNYIEDLRQSSPESYALFRQSYGSILFEDYAIYLPRFPAGMAELTEFLSGHPAAAQDIPALPESLSRFPVALHPYLLYCSQTQPQLLSIVLDHVLTAETAREVSLPRPRQQEVVYKFEDSNPYKEPGLKTHFDRLSRFSFVSRLQSYRYLTRNKASRDRIEVVDGQTLGGIFTNKEKSIYYYIYLTEDDPSKAKRACRLLNDVFYRDQ